MMTCKYQGLFPFGKTIHASYQKLLTAHARKMHTCLHVLENPHHR